MAAPAVDWVVAYVESIRSMPVAPDTSSAQLRAAGRQGPRSPLRH
jgi:hypothetical protein